MTSGSDHRRFDTVVWVCIFGGLLALVLGLAVRALHPAWGWAMVAGGALLALVGVMLIFVRARGSEGPDSIVNPKPRP